MGIVFKTVVHAITNFRVLPITVTAPRIPIYWYDGCKACMDPLVVHKVFGHGSKPVEPTNSASV